MRSLIFAACLAVDGLASFAAALPEQVFKRVITTSTVTAAAHPLTFWPLDPMEATVTPFTYALPPTASKVPTAGLHRVEEVNCTTAIAPSLSLSPSQTSTSAFASASVPISYTPTSTTICTVIKGNSPESTLPAFCRPRYFSNAPSFAAPAAGQTPLPTAIVTMGANSVPDKLNCCAECAAYYNCFAWRFVPSYVGTPSDRLPGGFDPWRHGNCEIAYYMGINNGNGTSDSRVTRHGAPSICPNGRLQGMLSGTMNPGHGAWSDGLYYNGWNEGACGDLGNVVYFGGGDEGYGDDSSLCDA